MADFNKVLIPNNILEELKCVLCSNYLSVPTVNVYHIKEGYYVCGRCTGKFPSQGGIRASAYEAVAKLLLFPCRYSNEGCKKQLSWGSVLEHESSCEYHLYECPALPRRYCGWVGPAKNIVTHFKELHRSLYMDEPSFQMPLEEHVEMNKILFVLNELFLVQIISEVNKKFYICVKYIGKPLNAAKFNYEIELIANTKESSLKICSRTTEPVLKFDIDKKCMSEIDITSLISIMNTINIICNISIKNKEHMLDPKKPVQEQNPVPTKENARLDKNLLVELECPICQEYMIPPIFICGTGHSICGNCKQKLSNCPSCTSPYSGARNYSLEKLTTIVNYPCKNENRGCKFVANSQDIRTHENICSLSFIKCPLEIPEKCNWKGPIVELMSHSNQCHSENTWIKLNESLFRNLTSTVYIDFHIISFENELFKICCKHSKSPNGPIQWSFQHIGLDTKDKPRYKFEIDFVDINNSGRKLIINDLCYGLKEFKDAFDYSLSVPNNLLLPFINKESCVIFKYNMSHV